MESITKKLSLLPKIEQLVQDYQAKKSLGQNFLINDSILYQIVAESGIDSASKVVEIGPGLGFLSRELIRRGVCNLALIEKDTRFIPLLKDLQEIQPQIQIYEEDALRFAYDKLGTELNIIANLPYNIGTKLLLIWLSPEYIDHIQSITVMLQAEVVDRICAKPSTGAYGSLSIFVQSLCDIEELLVVPPTSFVPMPKVSSKVVRLIPKESKKRDFSSKELDKICRQAFAQRRKTLRNTLKKSIPNISELLAVIGKTDAARAEELSVEDYLSLLKIINNQ